MSEQILRAPSRVLSAGFSLKLSAERLEAARVAGAIAAEAHQKASKSRYPDIMETICDLLHYAHEAGENPTQIAEEALGNFHKEIGEVR